MADSLGAWQEVINRPYTGNDGFGLNKQLEMLQSMFGPPSKYPDERSGIESTTHLLPSQLYDNHPTANKVMYERMQFALNEQISDFLKRYFPLKETNSTTHRFSVIQFTDTVLGRVADETIPDLLREFVEKRSEQLVRNGLAITWNDDSFRDPEGYERVMKKMQMLAAIIARTLFRDAQNRLLRIVDGDHGAGYGPGIDNHMDTGNDAFHRKIRANIAKFGLVQRKDGLAKLLNLLQTKLTDQCDKSIESIIVPPALMFQVALRPEHSRFFNSGKPGGVQEPIIHGVTLYKFTSERIQNQKIEDFMRVMAKGDFLFMDCTGPYDTKHYKTAHRTVDVYNKKSRSYEPVRFLDALQSSFFVCKQEGMVDDGNGKNAPDWVFTQEIGLPVMGQYATWGELFRGMELEEVLRDVVEVRSVDDNWKNSVLGELREATGSDDVDKFVNAGAEVPVASDHVFDIVFRKFREMWMDSKTAQLILGTYAGLISLLDANPAPAAQKALSRLLKLLRHVGNVTQFENHEEFRLYLAGGEYYGYIMKIMQHINKLDHEKASMLADQFNNKNDLGALSFYATILAKGVVQPYDEEGIASLLADEGKGDAAGIGEEKGITQIIMEAAATNADILYILAARNLPIPLNIILGRPFRRFACGAIRAISKSPFNDTVGNTFHKQGNFTVYHNPDKTSLGSFTIRSASVVSNPSMVAGIDEAFVPHCLGGFGCDLFNLADQSVVRGLREGDVSGASIIPMVTTTPLHNIPFCIDSTGFHHEEEKVGEEFPHADSLPFYASYLNQSHIDISPQSTSYDQYVPANLNTTMIKGDYLVFDPETKRRSHHCVGVSHTGGDGMDPESIVHTSTS